MGKKITNTADQDVHLGWLMGGNPNAIEAQEARGQRELVEKSFDSETQQLPRKSNSYSNVSAIETYKELGIEVLETSKGDDLFIDVVLPKGWRIESTDHSMWNRLVDDKGRERASIFYKAAFYDRDAFVNFQKRYYSGSEYLEKKDGDKFHPKYYCVKDTATGKELFTTKATNEYHDEKLSKLADKWLKKHFPDHEKITAYWD